MSNMDKRREIIDTGIELLEEKLVARTWGNISARIDADNYLITPSGLDYTSMREEDIVSVNIKTGEYTGINRPSGEKGVHSAAYEVFDDVNFVVHTHQTYATAVSLAGLNSFDITEEEIEKLGGIALAEYGLPGTKEITNACKSALLTGAHTVLMIHHGVLVLGKDKEEAMKRVKLLESICERNVKRVIKDNTLNNYLKALNTCPEDNSSYGYCEVLTDKALIALSNSETEIFSQLDDVSQMIGTKIVTVDSLNKALKLSDNAVLVKGVGALIKAENKDDLEALKVLMNKMAIVKLYTKAKNVKAEISIEESDFMHYDYVNRYSLQNNKNRKI